MFVRIAISETQAGLRDSLDDGAGFTDEMRFTISSITADESKLPWLIAKTLTGAALSNEGVAEAGYRAGGKLDTSQREALCEAIRVAGFTARGEAVGATWFLDVLAEMPSDIWISIQIA